MNKLKILELLKNGFRILVENPILVVLGIVVELPLILVNPEIIKSMFWVIIWVLLSPYFIGLIVRFIYESREKKPSLKELSKFALSKYIILLITSVICYFLTLIGLVLVIIPGIFLSIKLMFYDCGIILENDRVITSLKRSWRVTKGNWGRLFGLALVIILPGIIFSIFESLLPKVMYFLSRLLLNSCIFVWLHAAFTLAYLKLRE